MIKYYVVKERSQDQLIKVKEISRVYASKYYSRLVTHPIQFFAKLSMGFVNGLGPNSGYMIIPK